MRVGGDSVGVFKDVISVTYSSCYRCCSLPSALSCLLSLKVTVLVSVSHQSA